MLFLQRCNLGLQGSGSVFQLLQLQILLVQVQLKLLGVVLEEHVSLLHRIAFGHVELGHRSLAVPLNLRYLFRDHNARKYIAHGDGASACNFSYILYINLRRRGAVTAPQAQQSCGSGCRCDPLFSHSCVLQNRNSLLYYI